MTFDFERVYNRRQQGSRKWLAANEWTAQPADDIIPMTVADMDFATPEPIKKALKDYVDDSILGYTNPTADYLAAVQAFYKKEHDTEIDPSWITTTPGVVPALANAIRAYTEPGEGVIIMPPIYPPFYHIIDAQDRKVLKNPLELVEGHYEINFEQLEELAAQDEAKMLMLCSPHNPGGRVWTPAEMEKIANIVVENDLFLVSDEIHHDLIHCEHPHTVAFTADERLLDRCIVCSAASKTFNIAGLQCSNIIIPNEHHMELFLEELGRIGVQDANVLGMVATQAAYLECDEWLEAAKQVIERNLQIVSDFFHEWDDRWLVMEQEASFLAWIGFEKLADDADTFIEKMATESSFYVNAGKDYGEEGRYFIRINVGLPEKKLLKNLNRLKENLELN